MNNIKVIENLGFLYVETQVVGNVGGEYSNQDVDMYVNNTHRIFYWKSSNKFSIKNLKTTRTTMIIDFNAIMKFYFNEID